MKFLGIDFGEKRIGLALSDDNGTLAFPREIIKNDRDALGKIAKIISEEKMGEIVIGESVNSSGEANRVEEKIRNFTLELEKFNLPIHTQKEFFTSMHARAGNVTKESKNSQESHTKVKKESLGQVDAQAAALILQRYLDKLNK